MTHPSFAPIHPLPHSRPARLLYPNRFITSSSTPPDSTTAAPPATRRRQRPKPLQSPPSTSKSFQPSTRTEVRRIFKRAQAAERSGHISEARALLQKCLELDRHDAHSWLALARLEARTGLPDSSGVPRAARARALFEQGLIECPNNVHLLQAWAVLEHRCGDREAARELFQKGYDIEPQNPYISHAWGLLEQRVGNTEKARELFRKTIETRPHSEVCAAWGVLEAREGNVQKARELFEMGAKCCGRRGEESVAGICRSWAQMEERLGDLPRARELLGKAISSQPRMTESYIDLANLEARRGCTTKALELMATAAGLSRKPPSSVYNAWAYIEITYRNKLSNAKEILMKGYNLHPLDAALLQSLGIVEDKLGDSASARKWFQKSVQVRATAPAYVAWALLEDKNDDYEQARKLFEAALEADPVHGVAYNAYGMMEARRGNLDKARKIYDRGLKVCASSSVWHGYGQLELKLARNPARARELFRAGAAQTREDTAFIWHTWGMLELSEKCIVDARRVFENALKLYPRNSRLLVGAALAAAASCRETRTDDIAARDLFKRSVVADPTHAHAWQTWGVFELRCGKENAAQALFKRGLRLCPSHGALWQAWGVLEMSKGNFAKARKLFQRGASFNPNHVHLYQAWACMEVRAGNIDQARKLLDHALKQDDHHGAVWTAYGLLEARHGTIDSARQVFINGIRSSPNHAPLYRTYGETEVRAGNYDRARDLFRKGLRVDPRHAPIYHTLAKLEGMLGNVEGLAHLKREAEKYFGSEAEAAHAMQHGNQTDSNHGNEISEDEQLYNSLPTLMESALDGGDMY